VRQKAPLVAIPSWLRCGVYRERHEELSPQMRCRALELRQLAASGGTIPLLSCSEMEAEHYSLTACWFRRGKCALWASAPVWEASVRHATIVQEGG